MKKKLLNLLKQKSFYLSVLVIAIAGTTTAAIATGSLWFAASAVVFGLAQYNLQHLGA